MRKIESTANQIFTIDQAGALRRKLQELIFIYWLNVFNDIMPHVVILYNQLQKINTDPIEINKAINNFQISIRKERDNLNYISVDVDRTSAKKKKDDHYLTRN